MSPIVYFLATLSALCVAMPVHEWAHAFVAYKQGDSTAKTMGRMSLAAFSHFDIIGFICLFFLGFGWAKPVPIDSRNFKSGKKSSFLVSIAGVSANFIVGIFFIIINSLLLTFYPQYITAWGFYGELLFAFLQIVISMNFVLAFFNLLPIYPLDGFRIVETFSKPNNGFVNFMKRYSGIIIIMLVLFGYFILDIYFQYTAGYCIQGISWVFNKLFGLFV